MAKNRCSSHLLLAGYHIIRDAVYLCQLNQTTRIIPRLLD